MTKKNRIKLIVVAVWCAGLLGSISYNSVAEPANRIPYLPVVDISINGRELPVLESAKLTDGGTLMSELREVGIRVPITGMADRLYTVPQHSQFEEMTHWMGRFYWTSPKLRYVPEAYDCDNYARTLVVLSDFAFVPHLEKPEKAEFGQLTVFRMYVKQDRAWGGVPAGGYHALTIVRTSEGWHAHEPQSGAMTKIGRYPNLAGIMNVIMD